MSGCAQVCTRNVFWLCCSLEDRDVTSRTGSEAWSEFVLYCSDPSRWGYLGLVTILGYSGGVLGRYSGPDCKQKLSRFQLN